MNKKDIIEREYFRRNEKFASIFNYYLFDGKKVIKEDELEELDTTLITTLFYPKEKGIFIRRQYLKRMVRKNIYY